MTFFLDFALFVVMLWAAFKRVAPEDGPAPFVLGWASYMVAGYFYYLWVTL